MSLQAKFNAVIVKPKKNEDTLDGGIIIPTAGAGNNEFGTVIDVGPGQISPQGVLIPTSTAVGTIVILPTMGFTRFMYQGEEYYVGPENSILGEIIED